MNAPRVRHERELIYADFLARAYLAKINVSACAETTRARSEWCVLATRVETPVRGFPFGARETRIRVCAIPRRGVSWFTYALIYRGSFTRPRSFAVERAKCARARLYSDEGKTGKTKQPSRGPRAAETEHIRDVRRANEKAKSSWKM